MSRERMLLGRKLKNFRIAKGISVYQIVKDCKITGPTVTNIESGEKNYEIDKLLLYCKYIGYDPLNKN